jgi:hypothetical protein
MFKTITIIVISALGFLAVDQLMLMSEREDCTKFEHQVKDGYIKAVPAWCAEVPR